MDDLKRGRLLAVAPGLPTNDLRRTREDYERLGFTFSLVTDSFAIAERDGIELHFAEKAEHDPARTAMWIYLWVDDPDALYAEWSAAGVERLRNPRATDYKTWEGVYIDGSGNMLLFGCALAERP